MHERLEAVTKQAARLKKRYPTVATIAKNLTGSYPHEFGAQEMLIDVVLVRLGRRSLAAQMMPKQWTIGTTLVKEYFKVREEMGKGHQRRTIGVGEIDTAVAAGNITLPKLKKR